MSGFRISNLKYSLSFNPINSCISTLILGSIQYSNSEAILSLSVFSAACGVSPSPSRMMLFSCSDIMIFLVSFVLYLIWKLLAENFTLSLCFSHIFSYFSSQDLLSSPSDGIIHRIDRHIYVVFCLWS